MTRKNKITNVGTEKSKKCYIQARSFFLAAKRCGKDEICEESGSNQYLPIPEYVNIAFACELYIKVLLYIEEDIIMSHNLLHLFNRLEASKRHRVSKIMNIHEAQITKLLNQHSDMFRNMRYRFEYQQYRESFSMPINFFYSLAESLDKVAQETIGVEPYPSTNANIHYFSELFTGNLNFTV